MNLKILTFFFGHLVRFCMFFFCWYFQSSVFGLLNLKKLNFLSVASSTSSRNIKQQLAGFAMSQNDDIQVIRGNDDWNIPDVKPGRHHYVLYDVTTIGREPPRPARSDYYVDSKEDWENTKNYVRMPCSLHSRLYDQSRWEVIINSLKNPGKSTKELVDTILSYNPNYKNKWKFTALYDLLDDEITPHEQQVFFDKTLPAIVDLALKLPEIVTEPIPLLRQGTNDWLSMSQEQIASLLANAFLCTFPYRNSGDGPYKTYPVINFSRLYAASGSDVLEKLKCIIHYFRSVTKVEHGKPLMPNGVLTFCRRSVDPLDCPRWRDSGALLGGIPMRANSQAAIERCDGLIQLDFANKFLGGGVLGHGSVQEEIRFVISPELLVTKLFTEVLGDKEALLIIGAERYSVHVGYGRSLEWVGPHRDDTPRDSSARRRNIVLAIDALNMRSKRHEATQNAIDRELNKAWVGFSMLRSRWHAQWGVHYPGAATGNWGCGAFGGSPPLKALLQLAAAAQCGRPLLYITFQDEQFKDELNDIYRFLAEHDVTVGQLYSHILEFIRRDQVDFNELFRYLKSVIPDRGPNDHRRTSVSDQSIAEPRRPSTDSTATPPPRKKLRSIKKPKQNTQDSTQKEIALSSCLEMDSSSAQQEAQNSQDVKRTELNSPDLFTSEEMSVDETELDLNVIQTNISDSNAAEIQQPSLIRKRAKRVSNSDDEMAGYLDKMAATENLMASQTSRLFDQMEEFDRSNGNLNLSVSLKKHFNAETKKSEIEIDNDQEKIYKKIDSDQEMPREVKNKISKKITDYFNKTNKNNYL